MQERLQGSCYQCNFFIVKATQDRCISTENGGFCSLNLIVDLNNDEYTINLQPINKMYLLLLTEYFEKKALSNSFAKIENLDTKEFKVAINIETLNLPDVEENPEFKFLCTISRGDK